MNQKIFRKKHQNKITADLVRIRYLINICSLTNEVETCDVLEIDENENAIGYEYIDALEPLINSINDACTWVNLGIALSIIHTTSAAISQPCELANKYPLQSFGISSDEESFLDESLGISWFHGDFWHGNVFNLRDARFMVIDPIPSRSMFTDQYHFANGALDAATMYMSLHLVHPISRQILINPNRYTETAEAFLVSYLGGRGVNSPKAAHLIRKIARVLAERFIDSYRTRLMPPLSTLKETLALRAMKKLDKSIDWA